MIQDLLSAAVQRIQSMNASLVEEGGENPLPSPAKVLGEGVPTLAPNTYKPWTPMLKIRFEQFSAWLQATHGNWLSLSEMESIWNASAGSKAEGFKEVVASFAENWANDAVGLFKPERISIFALHEWSNERIYLLWFDFVAEPEVWAYDSNGEAHYKNLEAYLKAYLEDDLTAYGKQWILEYPST